MYRFFINQKKQHFLFVLVVLVLAWVFLYSMHYLHSSTTCSVAFMAMKQHLQKRSSKQAQCPWDYFNENHNLPEMKEFRGTKFMAFMKALQILQNSSLPQNKTISTIKEEIFRFSSKSNQNTSICVQKNSSRFTRRKNNTSIRNQRRYRRNLIDVLNHDCQPLHPEVVLYNRIFKTASTTMTSFFHECKRELKYLIRTDKTEEWSNNKKSHSIIKGIQKSAVRTERKGKRLMAIAHFYFRNIPLLKRNYTYINVLREPVDRFISHYYYARSLGRSPKKLQRLKDIGQWNVTLKDCLEKHYEGCQWNIMTRFFCGPKAFCRTGSKKALRRAKHNMDRYYAVVGILEHLNEFVQVLHKRLPDFVSKAPKKLDRKFVTTGITKVPLSDKLMARIADVNSADVELYKHAKRLFVRQSAKCGIAIRKRRKFSSDH